MPVHCMRRLALIFSAYYTVNTDINLRKHAGHGDPDAEPDDTGATGALFIPEDFGQAFHNTVYQSRVRIHRLDADVRPTGFRPVRCQEIVLFGRPGNR